MPLSVSFVWRAGNSALMIIPLLVLAVILHAPLQAVADPATNPLDDDWLESPLMDGMDEASAKVRGALDLIKADKAEQAVEKLRDAVDTDRDRDAQYILGWCYSTGTGTRKSLKEARDLYHGAALAKHRSSRYALGRLLLDSAKTGNKRMVESAISYLEAAAKQGLPRAMTVLGQIYRHGIHGSLAVNMEKATFWLEKAVDAGDAEALFHRGVMLETGEAGTVDSVRSVVYLKDAADLGSPAAMVHMGKKEAAKSPPNRTVAKEWFLKAEALNYADARHQLGMLLQKSEPKKAFDYYRHAAAQGHAEAQSDLGFCYEFGIGTEKSGKSAVEWYKRAADQGNMFGTYHLGRCYDQGIGVSKDNAMASKWYRTSGVAGLKEAQYMVGRRYLLGLAGEKDPVAAAAWFELAAEQGFADAICELGKIHETSKGMLSDPSKALRLYLDAVKQGHAESRFRLGTMYREGNGVPVDLSAAYILYYGAVEQGYKEGKRELESLARLLTPSEQKAAESRYKATPNAIPGGGGK